MHNPTEKTRLLKKIHDNIVSIEEHKKQKIGAAEDVVIYHDMIIKDLINNNTYLSSLVN